MKANAERLNDTKNYLSNHITPGQFNEVNSLIATIPNKNTLSAALSIGNSNPFRTNARRAKRSLMLLAMLLINEQGKRTAEVARIKKLPEGAEAPLIAEIKSWFILPGVTPDVVALHAKNNIVKLPKWNNVNYEAADAVRGVYNVNKPFNCYNGCVFWAFQAGAISKRYLWNELQGKDGNAFFPTYSRVGWDTFIEWEFEKDASGATKMDGNGKEKIRVVKDDSNGGEIVVPAGMTVYFETPTKVFGHVACSLGDGKVISQNSVNIGDSALALLNGTVKNEFDKMANAVTHIVSIRDMINQYFNPRNGYQRIKISSGSFWDPIPINRR